MIRSIGAQCSALVTAFLLTASQLTTALEQTKTPEQQVQHQHRHNLRQRNIGQQNQYQQLHHHASRKASESTTIIDNGVVMLGIHDEGHLNVPGEPDAHEGISLVGLRYFRDGAWYESTAFGSPSEGFGVSAKRKTDGFEFWGGAKESSGITNLVSNPMVAGADGVSATTSAVVGANEMLITHDFKPSENTANLYQVTVTYENLLSAETLTDLRYRRVMDWDIPPSIYNECVSLFYSDRPISLEYATDDGFESANPLFDSSTSGIDFSCPDGGSPCPVYDSGPRDHGALFQFHFKDEEGKPIELLPGETFSFDIFFGAAATKEEADKALDAVDAQIATFGYPPNDLGCDASNPGSPNVFMIAFKGVGGKSSSKNVHVDYFDIGEISYLPDDDFASMTPYKSEYVGTIDFPKTAGEFAGSEKTDLVGAVFEGYYQPPVDGAYGFCLTSDDGSKLYIDDDLMIDNDGLHPDVTKCEEVVISSESPIKIRIPFFERYGGATLVLTVQLPGGDTFEPIPAEAWVVPTITAELTMYPSPEPSLSPTESRTTFDPDYVFEIVTSFPSSTKWCVQPESLSVDSDIIIKHCDGSTVQKWVADEFGRIMSSAMPSMCMTVGAFDIIVLDYCGSSTSGKNTFMHDTFEETIVAKEESSMALTIASISPEDNDILILWERDRSLLVQEWKVDYFVL